MKLCFALVFLLQLCAYGLSRNRTLNREILDRLKRLDEHWEANELNLTSDSVRVPSVTMINNVTSCISVFVMELKSLLSNITVHEDQKHIVIELRGNLNHVKSHPKNNSRCKMTELMINESPFQPYQRFIRKWNSMRHAA